MRDGAICLSLCSLLIASCDNDETRYVEGAGSSSEDGYLEYFVTPQYGEEMSVSGRFSWYFESSQIGLCEHRENCEPPTNVDGSHQPCWVEFIDDPSVNSKMKDLKDGSYWLSGKGKIAVLPGSFGHLSRFTCQIEITEIDDLVPDNSPALIPTPLG